MSEKGLMNAFRAGTRSKPGFRSSVRFVTLAYGTARFSTVAGADLMIAPDWSMEWLIVVIVYALL